MFSPGCLRIGHGGASELAPANTLASFDAAAGVGVDIVEFDVREYRGELVLAHTVFDQRRPRNLRLDQALSHLSQPRFDGIDLNVDVKRVGFESRLLGELAEAGFVERTVVSSQIPLVLDRLRELEPRLRLGISVGGRVARMSRRWRDWRAERREPEVTEIRDPEVRDEPLDPVLTEEDLVKLREEPTRQEVPS